MTSVNFEDVTEGSWFAQDGKLYQIIDKVILGVNCVRYIMVDCELVEQEEISIPFPIQNAKILTGSYDDLCRAS